MQPVRGHNEGTIFRRADTGHKIAAISLPDGRRRTRSCPHEHDPGDRDCPEVRKLLRDLLELGKGGPAAVDGARMTLGQYLSGWLVDVKPRLAPATWSKHESVCRVHLIPHLGAIRLPELSVGHVRGYLSGASGRGLDAQSVRHHRSTLRRALADALRDGYVTRNVAALAEPPPLPHRERQILTTDQVRTLIDGTAGYRLPPGVTGPVLPPDRLHALWVLLVTTGLREAEALGLTWAAVDLDGASLRVVDTLHRIPRRRDVPGDRGKWERRDPKTAKSRRTVILPPITVDALRAHRARQLEEWLAAGRPGEAGMVFVTPRGRPIHGPNLTKVLYAHLDRLGLPRVSCHDLRHCAATILFDAGVDLEDVAKMLGHTDSRMLRERYVHVHAERSQAVAAAMERAVG